MRRPNNAPWRSGCGARSRSCPSGAAWRSCCSMWKGTRTPRSPGSWGFPRGPCARRCSTRAAGCACCWRTGRRTDDAGTAAVRSPARSGGGRRRSGPLGPCRLRQCAGARPRRRPVDGRIERRAGLDVAAARRRPRHPAAPLDADERALGFGPAALRLDARRNGLGGGGAAFAGPAGKVPRPYGPASASEGEDRLEREEAMSAVRHHLVAAAAAVVLHAPDALAAQGQPLAVTLGDAIRRALDVQPAMVQARGTARNAGAGERSAWGAFLPTVNTSASASRSNQTRFDPNSTNTLPPVYSYAGGLSASVVLFDGFNMFANLRASSAP